MATRLPASQRTREEFSALIKENMTPQSLHGIGTEERGRPRSSAARVKLRRSTMRVKTRMASKRSIVRTFE